MIIGSKQDKLEDIVHDIKSIRHPNLKQQSKIIHRKAEKNG